MTEYPRHAIYFVPPADSALYQFGAELLGYDGYRAIDRDFPTDLVQQVVDWRELTTDPRKYGFHATMKAPFSLRSDRSEDDLMNACRAFAQTARAALRIFPVVNAIGDFIAIVPAQQDPALTRLASDCVTAFEPFRAPMTPEDRARRNPDRLTARQVQQLDQWGYPYVFDDFRFHMTLTGRIPAARRSAILEVLRARFARLEVASIAIGQIALCRQAGKESRFTVIETFAVGS